ncbi:hypothetical protein CDD83_6696 [Cordyceps sp. RAO-2017]|nr:hypothetical protein CDD83_6696 [Cordyceps sp. RAO-2017]
MDHSSSQGTAEDGTLPGSEAGEATVLLVPENAEARLAFSEVAEWLQKQSEVPAIREAQDHARKYMCISSNQEPDAEATSLMRRLAGDLSSCSSVSLPRSPSPSPIPLEPDLELWTGFYYLALDRPPQQPLRGWTAGILRHGNSLNDLVLCLRSAIDFVYGVRRHQAILQIHSTGLLYVQTASARASTYVNGNRVSGQIHLLNEATMTVTFGALRYRAEYARFAHSESYPARLHRYLREVLGSQPSHSMLTLTPTPSESGSIKVGQWTLTTGTIGSGAAGRVSVGVNSRGQLVALKRMIVGRDRAGLHQIRQRLETLGSLAASHDEPRLLRLVEMITDDDQGANRTADLWFVLEPAVADTLGSLVVKGHLATGDER